MSNRPVFTMDTSTALGVLIKYILKRYKCDWCSARMKPICRDYGSTWTFKCNKCHHEKQGVL